MLPMPDETIVRKTLYTLLMDPADDREGFYNRLPHEAAYRDPSGAWIVGNYRLARAVLNHPDLSNRSPLFEHGAMIDEAGMLDMMLFEVQPMHERLRKAFAPLFSKARLVALRDSIQSDLATLAARIPDTGRFDIVEHIARHLPAMTACRLLGIDVEHAPAFIDRSLAAIQLISAAPLAPRARVERVEQTIDWLRELETHLPAVRALLESGSSTSTCPAAQDIALTPRQLLVNILLIFIAGFGTTMLSIANTVCQALTTSGLWPLLVREPQRAPLAIRELMRVEPAVHLMIRYARSAVELDGLSLASGDVVAVVAAAANRDPAEFDAPGDVRIDRAHQGLVFGAGAHGCIGIALARMQIEAVFDMLLARMPDLSLEPGPHPRLQEGVFRGYRSLWVCSSRRN